MDYPVEVLDQYFSFLAWVRYPAVLLRHRFRARLKNTPQLCCEWDFLLIWDIAEKAPDWRNGFILQNNGFNIFLRVLVETLKFYKGDWNKQKTKTLLEEPLKLYFEENFEKIKEIRIHTSNEAGRAKVALEIIKHINQKNEDFAREFIKEYEKREKTSFEKSEPYQILKELENELRKFIEENLKAISKDWWKERVPLDVQEKAKNRIEVGESPWPWTKSEEKTVIHYIDFPDYIKIIRRKDNWNQVFKNILKDEEVFCSKLRELEPIRNNIAHTRNINAQESTTLRLYAEQIIKTIGPKSE